jgi:predicted nucleic acid-binding protein
MFVLDASALAKTFLEEPRSEEFRTWLRSRLMAGDALVTPRLAFSEIGRIIQKELPSLSTSDRMELHAAVLGGVRTFEEKRIDVAIWKHAARITFYDAEYLHVAQQTGGTLVTADATQLDEAKRQSIPTISFVPPRTKRSR